MAWKLLENRVCLTVQAPPAMMTIAKSLTVRTAVHGQLPVTFYGDE